MAKKPEIFKPRESHSGSQLIIADSSLSCLTTPTNPAADRLTMASAGSASTSGAMQNSVLTSSGSTIRRRAIGLV
jgi:hypothetical protein